MRIATFNLQNLRLRKRDGQPVLDGAADQFRDEAPRPAALARADRAVTARVIAKAQADFVALQEVFDLASLDFFQDRFLLETGWPVYPHRYCLEGNDGRGLNVAALSRRRPFNVRSHAHSTGDDLGLQDLPADLRNRPIFRRDCLELEFDTVTLFVCHFKAPYPDRAKAHAVRNAEARAVRKIVEARFSDPNEEHWVILGDFNEPAEGTESSTSSLSPLTSKFAVDLLDRLIPGEDWTYEVPETHLLSRPDRILVPPRMASDFPDAAPRIIRSGMQAVLSSHGHPESGAPATAARASDHALVYADFPGL